MAQRSGKIGDGKPAWPTRQNRQVGNGNTGHENAYSAFRIRHSAFTGETAEY